MAALNPELESPLSSMPSGLAGAVNGTAPTGTSSARVALLHDLVRALARQAAAEAWALAMNPTATPEITA
ncbi:MAG: hypothetical protein JWR10_4810 [Rubritepida sp.]|nr:hypothetical protein [Rubritepida sp.]